MYDIFRIFTKYGRWCQVLARGGSGDGPVFWDSLSIKGILATVLMARIMQGGGLAKFLNRHWEEVMLTVEEEMNKRRLEVVAVEVEDLAEGRHLIVS